MLWRYCLKYRGNFYAQHTIFQTLVCLHIKHEYTLPEFPQNMHNIDTLSIFLCSTPQPSLSNTQHNSNLSEFDEYIQKQIWVEQISTRQSIAGFVKNRLGVWEKVLASSALIPRHI